MDDRDRVVAHHHPERTVATHRIERLLHLQGPGHGFELTPLAERLSPLVAEAVEAASALLRVQGPGCSVAFDAAASSRQQYAVAGTGMCAFVPRRLARRCLTMLGVVIAETPLRPIRITEAAHWHARGNDDPAGVWLRQLVRTDGPRARMVPRTSPAARLAGSGIG